MSFFIDNPDGLLFMSFCINTPSETIPLVFISALLIEKTLLKLYPNSWDILLYRKLNSLMFPRSFLEYFFAKAIAGSLSN